MIPAGRLWASTEAGKAADRTRLVCIEQVHGAAGCNDWGATRNLWSPAETGKNFDLSPSSLKPLEPFRKYLTIISDTDARMADAFMRPKEIGGDHFRTSAVFLTQARPKQTQGSDVFVGTSFDQLYVQSFGQDTPIPSMQLSIENVDQAGGCAYGYACVYTDTISWATPSQPLPMIRDPRAVFEQLFGAGGTAEQRAQRLTTDRSILDWVMGEMSSMRRQLGPPTAPPRPVRAEHPRARAAHPADRGSRTSSGEERQIPRRRSACPTPSRSTSSSCSTCRSWPSSLGHHPGLLAQAGPGRVASRLPGVGCGPRPSTRLRTTAGGRKTGSSTSGGSTNTTFP